MLSPKERSLSCRFRLLWRSLATRPLFSPLHFSKCTDCHANLLVRAASPLGTLMPRSNSGGVCQSAVPYGLGQKGCGDFSGLVVENWFSEAYCYWKWNILWPCKAEFYLYLVWFRPQYTISENDYSLSPKTLQCENFHVHKMVGRMVQWTSVYSPLRFNYY